MDYTGKFIIMRLEAKPNDIIVKYNTRRKLLENALRISKEKKGSTYVFCG